MYEPIKKRKKRTTKFTVPSPPEEGNAVSAEAGGSGLTPPHPYNQTHHHIDMGESADPSASQLDAWAGMGADASMSDSTVTTSPSLLEIGRAHV